MTDMIERTYQVDFTRVGRKRDVPPLTVTGVHTPDEMAEQVYDYVKAFLVSREFVVTVTLNDAQDSGTVSIDGGRFGGGTVAAVASQPPGGQV